MNGRHGAAVGESHVVKLLREQGGDPCIETHELIRGVAARTRGWSAGARRRKFDPAFWLCHSPLQPASTCVETVGESVPHGGGLDLRRHRATALTSG